MDQRTRFVLEAAKGVLSMTALCRLFGISRKTGYKWIDRSRENPGAPLVDRSHAPLDPPHALSSDMIGAILDMKARQPTWGPRKILARLRLDGEVQGLPAASTAGRLLHALGLVRPRRRRHVPTAVSTGKLSPISGANSTWCADFKGEFELRRGGLCYPLTVTDAHSRYVLCCQGYSRINQDAVRRAFERCFREHGLPETIRTDNGVPFATRTLSGLSRLAVWWIRLGIKPERIERGRPDQNGRHERMHRTLKEDVAARPEATLAEQQRAFDAFRRTFNEERPHEALGDRTPASIYRPSARPFPRRLPELVYPDHYYQRRLDSVGSLRWLGRVVYLSNCLAGELVGLEERPDGHWTVHFGPLELGLVDGQGRLLAARAV